MSKKKILIITRNLPPLVGGMERLNWHMADELTKYHQVTIIAPKGSKALKPQNVDIVEVPLKPLALFLLFAFIKGAWLTLKLKPKTLLAGSGLTAPLVWLLAKLNCAQAVAYLHGLDITANHTIYRLLWRSTFKRLDHVIVNSTPTKDLAMQAGVAEDKLSIICPGVSIPQARQSAATIQNFKQQHGLTNKKVLLSVGRLTTRKGLKEFIENALPEIVKAIPETVLVIVGEEPKNSLGAGIQTISSITKSARLYNVEQNIQFLGVITNSQQLATVYEAADIHIFPVRYIPDDPEGFGMVAVEAAAHGTPTVAFATGGIVDAVKDSVSGYLVDRNNYVKLSERVINLLEKSLPKDSIQNFSKQFEWNKFGKDLHGALDTQRGGKQRQAHAVLDLSTRAIKAKKIELLMQLEPANRPLRVLEVGCGSGGIAHYFSTHNTLNCKVFAVDAYDNRLVNDSYHFQKVDGVELPFVDDSFDFVITNHVIEHVGEYPQQLLHIKEIKRVLAPTGQCYLAVPNRWMLTEPHYQLKFLSWLPRSWRSRYLKLWRKGDFYDCEPFRLAELEKLLIQADVNFENLSVQATRVTFELEKPNSLITLLLRRIPDNALSLFRLIIPTLIYKIELKK